MPSWKREPAINRQILRRSLVGNASLSKRHEALIPPSLRKRESLGLIIFKVDSKPEAAKIDVSKVYLCRNCVKV
jgi:hypothetical protein